MVEVAAQQPGDGPAIEHLLDRAFGAGRHARPSYRLREHAPPLGALGLVARDGDRVVATLRFWPVSIDETVPALLLGPLAVDAAYRRRGIASALVVRGLGKARKRGHRIVAAVGGAWFFARLGFVPAAAVGLRMPAPADEARLVAMALEAGALDGVSGVLGPAPAAAIEASRAASAGRSASLRKCPDRPDASAASARRRG